MIVSSWKEGWKVLFLNRLRKIWHVDCITALSDFNSWILNHLDLTKCIGSTLCDYKKVTLIFFPEFFFLNRKQTEVTECCTRFQSFLPFWLITATCSRDHICVPGYTHSKSLGLFVYLLNGSVICCGRSFIYYMYLAFFFIEAICKILYVGVRSRCILVFLIFHV